MKILIMTLLGLVTLTDATAKSLANDARATAAEKKINAADILSTIRTLSSDEFEGRSPGTRGEEASVKFITGEFQRLGLKPGNPDGTYVQKVPMVGSTAEYTADLETKGARLSLTANDNFVAASFRQVPEIEIKNSDIIFVGYGVVAPEFGWDDYKGVDVSGKTLLMLINDPQVPDPKDPSRLDHTMFSGKAMTYYGRWPYKFEIAAKKRAAAAIIIHNTAQAGYPFSVVIDSFGRENFSTVSEDKNLGRVGVESWISGDRAQDFLKNCGQDLENLQKLAVKKDFQPMLLNAKFNIKLKRTERTIESKNVVGLIEGSDPKLKTRHLIYSAHWDHFGRDPKLKGDQIFHGAVDNASGIAALLETAKAFAALKKAPKASLVFIATTAEERGFLGSHYYVEHPLYPLGTTLADINYDGVEQWGRTKDLTLVGAGTTSLEAQLAKILSRSKRTLIPEDDPEKGMYFRTDQFEFSKVGVPAIWYRYGIEVIGKPPEYGKQKRSLFVSQDYHKVTDVIKPDWDLSGAVEDIQAFFQLGFEISQSSEWPTWIAPGAFKERRGQSARDRR